jgi:hypothetical protein
MNDVKNKIYEYLLNCDIKNLTLYLINNPGQYKLNFNEHETQNIIMKSCEVDNLSIFKLLLSFGTSINFRKNNNFIFSYACEKGAYDISQYIYNLGNIHFSYNNYDAFYKACYSSNTKLISMLYNLYLPKQINFHYNNNELFKNCCKQNLIDVVILLTTYTTFNLDIDPLFNDKCTTEEPFYYFCRYGYLDLAKAYYTFYNYDISSNTNEAICLACQEGHLDMVKWLYEVGADITYPNNWCIGVCITKDYLDILKWIKSLDIIDLNTNDYYFFIISCSTGNLRLAQWFYSFANSNIHEQMNYAFIYSCSENYIDIAKWLYSLGTVDIHADNDRLFKYICQTGMIDIAKWLYSLGNIDIHSDDEISFRLACMMNHIQLVKWLYSLGNINIGSNKNEAFVRACEYQDVELAVWLLSKNPDEYKLCINSGKITGWQIIKQIIYLENKEVDEILECPICFNNKSNLITSCNHQFCKKCIEYYVNKQTTSIKDITCPFCRQSKLEFHEVKEK